MKYSIPSVGPERLTAYITYGPYHTPLTNRIKHPEIKLTFTETFYPLIVRKKSILALIQLKRTWTNQMVLCIFKYLRTFSFQSSPQHSIICSIGLTVVS